MPTFDFSPLFRSTVGFDRLMNLLENSVQWTETSNGYPPSISKRRARISIVSRSPSPASGRMS